MAVQGINNIPFIQSNIAVDQKENNARLNYTRPRYKMAFIPAEIYDNYCYNGYCSGKLLNYLA